MKTATTAWRCSSPLRILSVPGTDFGGNPYIKYFCDSLEKAGISIVNIHTRQAKLFKFDILHLHWPEFFITERPIHLAIITAPTVLFYMAMTKLLHKKIVWTVHDVTPMKARHAKLLQLYLFLVRLSVDAYIFMSRSSQMEFVKIFPGARKKIAWRVPHGPYPVSATSPHRRAELRERLSGGANCLLIGFLGDIRPYKNPAALAYLPQQDPIGREIKVVIAGAIDPSYDTTEIETSFNRIPRGRLVRIRKRLSDQCLTDIIRAVDLVFLPYLRGSNSGFSMLALSCGQRLLCSALPVFEDFMDRLGPPWVYLFDHRAPDLAAELAAALSRLQHDAVDGDAKSRLRGFLDDCSFDHGAQQLLHLYRRLMD